MNFEYYFEDTPEFGLRMKILPNEQIKGDIFMIEGWLFSDVPGVGGIWIAFQNFMKSSDEKEKEFGGNSMIVSAVKDGNSTIEWCFYDKSPNSCTLPTEMLYEILKIWVAKKEELREEKENKKANQN